MAKGSATPRKKATKAAEPVAVPARVRSGYYQPRHLMAAAALLLLVLVTPVIIRRMPALSGRPEYLVRVEQIVITPPPRWIPPNLTSQVFERAGLQERQSLQDPLLSEKIAAAFHTHPWIETVVSVRKSFPPRVQVDVVYREPVAMVRGVDGFYPVDRHGVLLPARDFTQTDVEQYPVIERVASVPMGTLGEPWGDPAVTGAAELAATLSRNRPEGGNWWKELDLAAILVPRRVALADDADELQYQLRTSGGSEIFWGRRPGSRHPGELPLAQKIQRLQDFRRDYGGFDDPHGPYQIDIRPWQGIQRGILAQEPRSTQVQ